MAGKPEGYWQQSSLSWGHGGIPNQGQQTGRGACEASDGRNEWVFGPPGRLGPHHARGKKQSHCFNTSLGSLLQSETVGGAGGEVAA